MSDHVTVTPGATSQVAVWSVNHGVRTALGDVTRMNVGVVIVGGPPLNGYVMPAPYGRVHFGLLPGETGGATAAEVLDEIAQTIGPPEPQDNLAAR